MKKKIYLVGIMILLVLNLVACSGDTTSKKYIIGISQLVEHPSLDNARLGFEDGLKEIGIDADIVYQNAQGDIPTSLSIAQKFVKDEVDLIYAIATPAAQSAKQVTNDIPVLFSAVTDPVSSEIVDSWEDIKGNVTGTSDMAPIESQLKIFKKIDPNIEKIGILYNTSESNSEIQIKEIEKLAPNEGLEIVTIGVSNVNEIPQALDSLLSKVDALYALTDNMIASSAQLVSSKLIEKEMISVSAEEGQVNGGLLISNGLSYYELGKQTARMAKDILINEKSISDMPVELADTTILTINEKTLNELGLDPKLEIFKDAEMK